MADKTAEPAFVASDLLSQAEHGVDSQVSISVNRRKYTLGNSRTEVRIQTQSLERQTDCGKSPRKQETNFG